MLLNIRNCNRDPGLMLVRTAITGAASLSAPCYCKPAICLQISHELKIYVFWQSLLATTHYGSVHHCHQILTGDLPRQNQNKMLFPNSSLSTQYYMQSALHRVYVNKINITFKYCMYYKCWRRGFFKGVSTIHVQCFPSAFDLQIQPEINNNGLQVCNLCF